MGSGRRFALIGTGAALVGGLVWWAFEFGPFESPDLDDDLAAAVTPAVDAKLTSPLWRGALGGTWFCTEEIVEIRPDGDRLKVGLGAHCGEFARNGDGLVTGSGWRAPVVVTVARTEGGYTALTAEQAMDGAAYEPWVERTFSRAGAKQVLRRGNWDGLPDPADKARAAFGLPGNAPTRR